MYIKTLCRIQTKRKIHNKDFIRQTCSVVDYYYYNYRYRCETERVINSRKIQRKNHDNTSFRRLQSKYNAHTATVYCINRLRWSSTARGREGRTYNIHVVFRQQCRRVTIFKCPIHVQRVQAILTKK